MSRATTGLLLVSFLAAGAAGCEQKKTAPPPAASAQAATTASAKDEPKPELVAYPPGYVPPEDAGNDAEAPAPKTGICNFHDSSYDGQDTKSNEKMIVKVKDDKIVGAEYTYRGSYAVDGKSESLSVPIVPDKWLEFELPMTSGSKKFKVKIKGDDIELKGVAAEGAQGDCVWEKPPEPEKDTKKKKKKSK